MYPADLHFHIPGSFFREVNGFIVGEFDISFQFPETNTAIVIFPHHATQFTPQALIDLEGIGFLGIKLVTAQGKAIIVRLHRKHQVRIQFDKILNTLPAELLAGYNFDHSFGTIIFRCYSLDGQCKRRRDIDSIDNILRCTGIAFFRLQSFTDGDLCFIVAILSFQSIDTDRHFIISCHSKQAIIRFFTIDFDIQFLFQVVRFYSVIKKEVNLGHCCGITFAHPNHLGIVER